LSDLDDRRLNRSAESSLRVRAPVESCPANSSQPAAASRLLSWTLFPFSTSRSGSPPAARFPSLATFRPQGLVTLSTVYSFRARAGPISCRRRSWDFALRSFSLSQGVGGVSAANEPTCRFSDRYRRRRSDNPSQSAAAPGLWPSRESLAPSVCLARRPAGYSLGLFPFQGFPTAALSEIPPALLSRASLGRPGGRSTPTPQSINRLLLGLIRFR
jgi:hypothetical protein